MRLLERNKKPKHPPPPLYSAPAVVPPQHIIKIKSGDVVKYSQDNATTPTIDTDTNPTIIGQFVILQTKTAPYKILQTASGNLPIYNPNEHSGRIGLIQFGELNNTTKIYSEKTPLVFIPLDEPKLLKVVEINDSAKISSRYNHYLTPGVTVNATFIKEKLSAINAALKPPVKPSGLTASKKKGGRTKKRIRKHTHKRRRNYIKQSRKR